MPDSAAARWSMDQPRRSSEDHTVDGSASHLEAGLGPGPLSRRELADRHRSNEWDLAAVVASAWGGAWWASRSSNTAVLVFGALLLLGAVWMVFGPHRPSKAVNLFLLTPLLFGLLAALSMTRAQHGAVHHPLAVEVGERTKGRLEVVVASDPRPSMWGASILVRASRFERDQDRRSASNIPAQQGADSRLDAGASMPIVVDGGGRTYVLEAGSRQRSILLAAIPGDRLLVSGRFAPLRPGKDDRWINRHAVGSFQVGDIEGFNTDAPLWRGGVETMRRWVLGGTRWMPAPDSGLLAGFLVGDTRVLDPGVDADFKASGLTHLLAVSGSNVAFVLALTNGMRRRLSTRADAIASLVIVVMFAAITRAEPSVMRASAMAGIAVVTDLRGQRATGRRALGWAVAVLVLADPFLIWSIGFILSATASAGILWWSSPIVERVPGPAWVAEGLGVTAAAQLATTPVMLVAFGDIPVVSMLSNLLAGPLAEVLTTLGIVDGIAATALGTHVPFVAAMLQLPVMVLSMTIRMIASVSANVPLTLSARPVIVLGAIVSIAHRWRRTRMRRRSLTLTLQYLESQSPPTQATGE